LAVVDDDDVAAADGCGACACIRGTPTVAVVLAPIAIVTDSAPLAEQDALPDFSVPNAEEMQASNA
jgi:hypothetical protein